MIERFCLDTSVVVKALVREDSHEAAVTLIERAIADGIGIIAPTFSWAEVGSALRRKVLSGEAGSGEIEQAWRHYLDLPIEFVDDRALRERSWTLTLERGLPTLYDACFLACTELAIEAGFETEYWTADDRFVRALGAARPAYLRTLA